MPAKRVIDYNLNITIEVECASPEARDILGAGNHQWFHVDVERAKRKAP